MYTNAHFLNGVSTNRQIVKKLYIKLLKSPKTYDIIGLHTGFF